MQKQNAETLISNTEFAKLIKLARNGDNSAMYKIIELYRDDIQKICKYIKACKEDAFQSVVTDFIDLLVNDHSVIKL